MMEIWDKLKQPPEWAMKKIEGGRLNGKTDVSPMWRIQVLTEVFGPCGIGWKYEIVRTWTEDGDKGQKMIFRDINLYVKHEGNWSEAIPGTGGDMLIEQERAGLHCNDEAAKMALTDALGNAMKNLGVAAVVYSNGVDGTKYNRPKSPTAQQNSFQSTNTQPTKNNAATGQPGGKKDDSGMASDDQRKLAWKIAKGYGWSMPDFVDHLGATYSVTSSAELTSQQADELIKYLAQLQKEKDEAAVAKALNEMAGGTAKSEEVFPFDK